MAVFSQPTFAQPQASTAADPNSAGVEEVIRGCYDSRARGDEAATLSGQTPANHLQDEIAKPVPGLRFCDSLFAVSF